jgi:hypothetical protein
VAVSVLVAEFNLSKSFKTEADFASDCTEQC